MTNARLAYDAGQSAEPVSVLAVLTNAHGQEMTRLFAHTRWRLRVVESVNEAACELLKQPVSVVVCDARLADGTWRDMLHEIEVRGSGASLIVTCQQADDRLWCEVLNRGAYDLLAHPFEPREVYSVITAAWRHAKNASALASCHQ